MKQNRLFIYTIFLLAVSFTNVQAQESPTTAGGEAGGSGGTASYTVGQVFYTTQTGTNGNGVVQGVQQPYEISVVTGIPEAKGINLSVSAYPNPVTDYLILKIDNNYVQTMYASSQQELSQLRYQIIDIDGKIIKTDNIIAIETKINTENLVQGNYFLRLIDNNKAIKVFKIIKTQ